MSTSAAGLSDKFEAPSSHQHCHHHHRQTAPEGMPLENGKQSVVMACAPDRPSSVLWQVDSFVTDCDGESDLADRPRQMGFTCGGMGKSVCVCGRGGGRVDGINERRGGVSVGARQASNYLPT